MRQRWQTLQEHFIQVGDLFSPGTKGLLELQPGFSDVEVGVLHLSGCVCGY